MAAVVTLRKIVKIAKQAGKWQMRMDVKVFVKTRLDLKLFVELDLFSYWMMEKPCTQIMAGFGFVVWPTGHQLKNKLKMVASMSLY